VATNTAERTAKAAANSTTAERLARTGLAARGAVFLILAYLVVRIAFGALGSSSTAHSASGPGVAQAISAQPGGRLMLVLLGAGLLFFALFSTIDALMHHDDERSDVKRWGKRFVAVATAVLYACFAVYCVVAAAGDVGHQSAQQSDAEQAQWSAKVLNWPLGQFWLGLLGVVLMVIAVVVTVLACVPHFADRLERHRMSRRMWRFAIITGTAGYLGRAALFGTVGWFVMSAAIENDPQHGQGVDGAVRLLADNGAGGIFLVVVAAALACFGLYLFVEARYRKV
jgi:Mn2+/Fe2+ NRAMP family transporter